MVLTFLYGWCLQHLLEVRVVQSALCPEGDLSFHFLKAQKGKEIW